MGQNQSIPSNQNSSKTYSNSANRNHSNPNKELSKKIANTKKHPHSTPPKTGISQSNSVSRSKKSDIEIITQEEASHLLHKDPSKISTSLDSNATTCSTSSIDSDETETKGKVSVNIDFKTEEPLKLDDLSLEPKTKIDESYLIELQQKQLNIDFSKFNFNHIEFKGYDKIYQFNYEREKINNIINDKMYLRYRIPVTEWMIDVGNYFDFHPISINLAIVILDKVKPNETYSRQVWQMISIACLMISSKYNESESDVCDLHTLEEIIQSTISKETLFEYEIYTLKKIKWYLDDVLAAHFLSFQEKLLKSILPENEKPKIKTLFNTAHKLNLLFHTQSDLVDKKKPSFIAAAALKLSLNQNPDVKLEYIPEKLTGYSDRSIEIFFEKYDSPIKLILQNKSSESKTTQEESN